MCVYTSVLQYILPTSAYLDDALAPEHEVDGALAAAVNVHGVQEHVDHDVVQVRCATRDPLEDDEEAQVPEQ